MGRMEDALKKAAEDRERARAESGAAPASPAPATPVTAGDRVAAPAAASRASETLDERLVVAAAPTSPRAEEFRRMRANLASLSPAPRVIAVAAPSEGQGADVIAGNLALALAEPRSGKILLIDADLRRGSLASMFAVRPSPGLGEIILERIEPSPALLMPSPVPGLDVLPAGAEGVDAARMLRPGAFRSAVSSLATAYSTIIVVLPAVDSWADGRVIAADTDGVVLVSRIGGSDRASLKRAYDALVAARARVLGTVAFGG